MFLLIDYMSLSNRFVIDLIDPRSHGNKRSKFDLPQDYLSNLHLLDVGLYNANIDNSAVHYPSKCGVKSILKRARLRVGDTDISTLEEVQAQACLEHLSASNNHAEDKVRFDVLNATNISLNNVGQFTYTPNSKDYYLLAGADQSYRNQPIVANDEDGITGMINLSRMFDIFKYHPVLPPLKGLYLDLEWNNNASTALYNSDAVAGTFTVIQPTVLVERVVGMPQRAQKMNLDYVETIVDRKVVPLTTDGTVQQTSIRYGAFKGRHLKKFALMNRVTTNAGTDNRYRACDRSPAMYREKLQVYVNNIPILPTGGCDGQAMKLRYYQKAYGPLNIPANEFMPALADASGNTFDATDNVAQFSVFGVDVEQEIARLQVDVTRTGRAANPAQVGEYTLLIIGKCNARLVLDGDKVQKVY